jgi:Winged helix DNA-binding domain
VRKIDLPERRARLARRHRLAPGHRAADVLGAARSMVCLHGTDPATVYLSAWARVEAMTVTDMEGALYVDRSLVKHLAMRRTLFVFPRETLPFAQAGASNRVADLERRRLIREVEQAGLHRDGERWLSQASEHVLVALADGRELTCQSFATRSPCSRARSPTGRESPGAGRLRSRGAC